ncbi:MAG: hypothetical protein ACKOKF_12915, partial [Bacteroidota bacterium]
MNRIPIISPSSALLTLLLFFCSLNGALADSGYVQVRGKARKANNPESGVTISISAPGATPQSLVSKDNGTYNFRLELQKDYTITFSKDGLITKTIIFNTSVPVDEMDIIFDKDFNMDMFENIEGIAQDNSMSKPVAKFKYDPAYEDFEFDQNYSKQIKDEQLEARRAAEEIKKQKERSRLDSLNRVWNDSLARVKQRESEMAVVRAQQEAARKDSMARAQTALAAATAEKNRIDSLERVRIELAR